MAEIIKNPKKGLGYGDGRKGQSTTHVVREGESWASIAGEFGNQRNFLELMKANGGVQLRPGMVIQVPRFNKNPYISNEYAASIGMGTTQQVKAAYAEGGTGKDLYSGGKFYGWFDQAGNKTPAYGNFADPMASTGPGYDVSQRGRGINRSAYQSTGGFQTPQYSSYPPAPPPIQGVPAQGSNWQGQGVVKPGSQGSNWQGEAYARFAAGKVTQQEYLDYLDSRLIRASNPSDIQKANYIPATRRMRPEAVGTNTFEAIPNPVYIRRNQFGNYPNAGDYVGYATFQGGFETPRPPDRPPFPTPPLGAQMGQNGQPLPLGAQGPQYSTAPVNVPGQPPTPAPAVSKPGASPAQVRQYDMAAGVKSQVVGALSGLNAPPPYINPETVKNMALMSGVSQQDLYARLQQDLGYQIDPTTGTLKMPLDVAGNFGATPGNTNVPRNVVNPEALGPGYITPSGTFVPYNTAPRMDNAQSQRGRRGGGGGGVGGGGGDYPSDGQSGQRTTGLTQWRFY